MSGRTGGNKTILVVDDEDDVRESVREVLTRRRLPRRGHRRRHPSARLDSIKSEPELVLLDIWMPQVDGIGLLKEIKSQEPDLNVVMISGHGNIHTAVTATKFGAFDFLEKPVSLGWPLLTVQRALGESRIPWPATPSQEKNAAAKGGEAPSAAHGASNVKQKTLKKSVVLSGQGLHSGVKTGLILHPLPPNSGILFTGISGEVTVPAHLDYVGSTGYATSLRNQGFAVGTVEHLLAVLHSYGITNLLVKVQGEVPILDGSALEFCQAIDEAGIEEQDEESRRDRHRPAYRVEAKGGESITIEPADIFSVRYELRYPKPVGEQEYSYHHRGAATFQRGDRAGADLRFSQRHRQAANDGSGRRRPAEQFYSHRRREDRQHRAAFRRRIGAP